MSTLWSPFSIQIAIASEQRGEEQLDENRDTAEWVGYKRVYTRLGTELSPGHRNYPVAQSIYNRNSLSPVGQLLTTF